MSVYLVFFIFFLIEQIFKGYSREWKKIGEGRRSFLLESPTVERITDACVTNSSEMLHRDG